MERLGYTRYGVQGGDWGSEISRNFAITYGERVIGVHLNLLLEGNARQEPMPLELRSLGEAEGARTMASWEIYRRWRAERSAYSQLQASRPQTIASALTDSPVGQLAWIAEKFH